MNHKTVVQAAAVLSALLAWDINFTVAQQPHKPARKSAMAAKARPKDWTLGEFREKYVGQRILILKGLNASGSLGGWDTFKQRPDGEFEPDFSPSLFISFRYYDQTPTVVAIKQQESVFGRSSEKQNENALGESLREEDVVALVFG